jgi:hypothetical protein
VSRLSRQCGILYISQPYRTAQPVMGIVLLFFTWIVGRLLSVSLLTIRWVHNLAILNFFYTFLSWPHIPSLVPSWIKTQYFCHESVCNFHNTLKCHVMYLYDFLMQLQFYHVLWFPSRWPRGTLYPQKCSSNFTDKQRSSVAIVRSRTQATEFSFLWFYLHLVAKLFLYAIDHF